MSKNPNLVELRPIERKKWHEKTGKDSFTQKQGSEVLLDPNTGKYATGLTEKEAEKYGNELGLNLSDTYNPSSPHPYWSTQAAKLRLPNETLVLDISKPMDFIKVKNYKASIYVANSEKELESGLWPHATHILYDEGEHLEMEAHKINKTREAYKLIDKMTKEQKINVIQVILDFSARKQSNEFIDVQLEKAIEQDIEAFLKYGKMDKTSLYIRSMVMEAIYKNILTKEGAGIFYMGDILGHNIDDVVEYFMNPQNQDIKGRILEKLNN